MAVATYDVLVIGSGAAGLRAAIAAADRGARVGVLSKGSPGKKTATVFSGGVFAGSAGGPDTDTHRRRTLAAGRGLNQAELVEVLVAEAPARLAELADWGISGELRQGYLYAKGPAPIWGRAIVDCLVARCRSLAVEFLPGRVAVRLAARPPGFAVLALSPSENRRQTIAARAVVLATGGAAALYARHDNPQRMLGDGWRLALEAGAVLQDLEFVQFYPLGLFEPGRPAFVIPPRLADCGRLVDERGRDIHDRYGITERPAAERARDKLSQALFEETFRRGGSVRLDLSGVPEAEWHQDPFSASSLPLLGERYGARYRPVRVAPMAHHTMGGVVIDTRGATTVPGLFAAGEVTGGLHGANRMGGNALSETVVFGARAGNAAAGYAATAVGPMDTAGAAPEEATAGRRAPAVAPRPALKELRGRMWELGGILRSAEGLASALAAAAELRRRADGWQALPPREAVAFFELETAALAAELVLTAADRRTESRGSHCRSDHPAQDDERWAVHLQVRRSPEGGLVWRQGP